MVLADNRDDTNTRARKSSISSHIQNFYTFFEGRDFNNIVIKPLRICEGKYIFNKLSQFQKTTTFAIIDKNDDQKILGYVLFIPAELIKSKRPRIMSWNLQYAFGVYYFEDFLGKKGMEFLFKGNGAPEKPIRL